MAQPVVYRFSRAVVAVDRLHAYLQGSHCFKQGERVIFDQLASVESYVILERYCVFLRLHGPDAAA